MPIPLASQLPYTLHTNREPERRAFTLHTILFALPGEEWRIDELLELRGSPTWSREHERREGELLGHDGSMNDHFLSIFYPA